MCTMAKILGGALPAGPVATKADARSSYVLPGGLLPHRSGMPPAPSNRLAGFNSETSLMISSFERFSVIDALSSQTQL